MTLRGIRPTPVEGAFLAWLYLVVLWLTWTPTGAGVPELLLRPPSMPWTVFLGNLLLFAPIAAVLASLFPPGAQVRRRAASVALLIAGLSVGVELGQFLVPGRSISPYDVLLNTGGGAAVAGAVLMMRRRGLDRRIPMGAACGAVGVGVLVFLSAMGVSAQRMLQLDHWNPAYQVVAGDEWEGGRTYDGEVTVPRLCTGEGAATTGHCIEPGADEGQREAFVAGVHDSQRIRVTARVVSAGPQNDFNRIVTFSQGTGTRNVTLGQEEEDLRFRVRTPLSGPNGTTVSFRLPESIPTGEPTTVVAEFHKRGVDLVAEAPSRVTRRTFRWGFLSGWWLEKGESVTPGALLAAMLVGALGFSLPIALAVGQGLKGVGLAPGWLQVGGAAAAAPVLVLLVAGALGVAVPIRELLASGAVGLLGAMVPWISVNRSSPGD
jgi:hypothetical protein